MKVLLGAALIIMLAPGSMAYAQQAAPQADSENQPSQESSPANTSQPGGTDSSGTVTGEPARPKSPPLTEEQQKARDQLIKIIQGRVDDCHVEFMGLPVEHEACVKNVLLMADTPEPGQ